MKKIKLNILSIIIAMALVLMFFFFQKIERFADTSLLIEQETIFKLPVSSRRVALEGLLIRHKLVRIGRCVPMATAGGA